MKQLNLILLLVIGMIISCKKEDPTPEPTPALRSTIVTPTITQKDLLGRWKIPFTMPQGYYTFNLNNSINRTFTESKDGIYSLTDAHLRIDIDSTFFDRATHFDLTECYISNDTLYGKRPNQSTFYKLCYR